MITVHHLNNSRSQRILWLLEELNASYEIESYSRDKVTNLAPESLKKIHPLGKSPVISEDGKTSGIVVYLKKDERLAEYIKIKDKYFEQSNETGLSKEEKVNYKKFNREYEDYKNLYNIRNHQNITEIRDVISKYGENAKIYLGSDFMYAVEKAKYREVADQIYQVHLLYSQRTDVVIADKNIFMYMKNKAIHINTKSFLTFHPIFKPSPYKMIFKKESLRNDFNQGLAQLKANGRYQKILSRLPPSN